MPNLEVLRKRVDFTIQPNNHNICDTDALSRFHVPLLCISILYFAINI